MVRSRAEPESLPSSLSALDKITQSWEGGKFIAVPPGPTVLHFTFPDRKQKNAGRTEQNRPVSGPTRMIISRIRILRWIFHAICGFYCFTARQTHLPVFTGSPCGAPENGTPAVLATKLISQHGNQYRCRLASAPFSNAHGSGILLKFMVSVI